MFRHPNALGDNDNTLQSVPILLTEPSSRFVARVQTRQGGTTITLKILRARKGPAVATSDAVVHENLNARLWGQDIVAEAEKPLAPGWHFLSVDIASSTNGLVEGI